MIGSSRVVPASLLLAITLAVVPMLLPSGLFGGSGPAVAAGHGRPPLAARAVLHLAPVHLKLAPLALPATLVRRARPAIAVQSTPRITRAAAHTVVDGDTLWDLANAAGLTVAQLAAANGLSEDATLRLGQVLQVPARGTAPVIARAVPAARGTPEVSRPIVANRVQLLWPTSGVVTSRFGWRIQPIFRRPEFHTGVDIATRWGSPVMAARGGVVRFVGWQSGYGRMVIVSHGDGLETSYSHLSTAVVSPGERVGSGQLIGRIGNTGWSTGPHLFFEVRWHGVPVDPTRYLH